MCTLLHTYVPSQEKNEQAHHMQNHDRIQLLLNRYLPKSKSPCPSPPNALLLAISMYTKVSCSFSWEFKYLHRANSFI